MNVKGGISEQDVLCSSRTSRRVPFVLEFSVAKSRGLHSARLKVALTGILPAVILQQSERHSRTLV